MSEDIEHLYKEHYPALVRYITSLCSDPSLAEDIAQDAFVKAFKKIDTFDGRSTFQTWLFAIGKNELLRHYRKHKKSIHDLDLEHPSVEKHTGAHASTCVRDRKVEDQVADGLLAKQIQSRIQTFDEPLRTIAELRLIDERPFKEIAYLVERPETYCRVSLFRVKRVLRKEYSDEH